MAQPDRNSSRDNKRNNEPNFNWRGIVLIAIAFGLIGMALLVRNGGYQNIEDVPYNRFIELLDNKQIINDKNLPVTLLVQEGQPTQALIGYYRKQTAGAEQAVKFRTGKPESFRFTIASPIGSRPPNLPCVRLAGTMREPNAREPSAQARAER
jgi:hypothetical protein